MKTFTNLYTKLTGTSYEYAVSVWYGLPDNLRQCPEYAAELKARDFKSKKRA